MFKKHLKDYFIPHEGNNYAPNSLERGAMLGMLCLVLLSFTATNIFSFLWINSSWLVGSVLPGVIVNLTNEEREVGTLVTLRHNSLLDEAARLKAEDMAKNSYFAHYSPGGVSPWHWFGEVDYNFVHAGENLAVHFTDSSDVVDAWMKSPTHRANIMNGNYTEIGVGTAEGEYEGFKTVFVVQMFGTPAAPASIVQAVTPAVPIIAGETTDTVAVPGEQDDTEVLSESVTLTETVTIKEAEPIPVTTVETVPEPAPNPVPVDTKEFEEQGVTEVVEVETPKTALYSDFISTSTGGVPATIDPTKETTSDTPLYAEVATQPHRILQMLYMVIGTCVFISLMFSIFIEIRRQQPVQTAYGVGLLSLMFALFYVHSVISYGAAII